MSTTPTMGTDPRMNPGSWANSTQAGHAPGERIEGSFAPAQATAIHASPPAPARGKARVAGLLAAVVLAAGVGGGTGIAIDRYLGPRSATNAVQTEVVQADASNPNWTTVAAAAMKSVVAIEVVGRDGSSGEGSGVVIDAAGNIVTNNHVVSGAGSGAQLTVTLDDTTYAAEIVGTDPATDLAVIRLVNPPDDLAVMAFADSNSLEVGDPVMAVGNPLGLTDTVTTGIVSALDRPVTTSSSEASPIGARSDSVVVTAAIQTSAAINPGNSGGALVNSAGQLVGITSSIASLSSSSNTQSGNIGIGFAIPADQVANVAEQLMTTGQAQHPRIGVAANDVQTLGQQGAQITQVSTDSPAATAGLRTGDIVTAVNGRPVTSSESLVALVRAQRVGTEMTLTISRDGSTSELQLTPAAA